MHWFPPSLSASWESSCIPVGLGALTPEAFSLQHLVDILPKQQKRGDFFNL